MRKKVSVVMMCVVAIMISMALPCLAQAAWIATDYPSYAQGDVVIITGFGWQPGEPVSLSLYDATDPGNPQLWYTFSNPYSPDGNGIFNAQYSIPTNDEGRTLLLVAWGDTSGQAQTTFVDAGLLRSYKDATHNIPRDAFAWGSTVYARASGLNSRPCWQIKWIDPNNVVVTHPLDFSTSSSRDDSFVVPASGPSGIWKAELWRPDNSSACPSSFTGSNPQFTLYFDVAQIVVIGADDSYITNHTPNFNSNSSTLFKYNLDVNNDSNDLEKTFVRFTLPILPGNVRSARVRMRVLVPPSFSSSRTYNINRVTGAWDVNTITFNLQPGVAGAPTDSQPTPTGLSAINSLMRWDVTSDVMGFAHGSFANNGWRIVDSLGGDPEGIFFSTEANTLIGNELEGPVLLIDTDPFSVPTMTEWGMIIFMILAGIGSVYYLRKRGRV